MSHALEPADGSISLARSWRAFFLVNRGGKLRPSTKLTVHRDYDRDRRITSLRLADLLVVGRGGLSWSFVVDTNAGEQLALQPNDVS